MGFSAGFLIYSGVMPLVKMFLTIFFGFWLSRKGLFPHAASRGASQVTMNVALPGLIFSSVVPAFNSHNVSSMGPLFLQAFFYMICGAILGLIIREFFFVPRNFWQGIVVATALSNWGNLPTAIVLTVTQSAPFDPKTDPALGVSFVSIFIVSYNIVMWIFGAGNSLAWDFAPGIPQGEAAQKRLSWREKPIASMFFRLRNKLRKNGKTEDCEKASAGDNDLDRVPSCHDDKRDVVAGVGDVGSMQAETSQAGKEKDVEALEMDPEIQLARRTSKISTSSARSRRPSAGTGTRPPPPLIGPPGGKHPTAQTHQMPTVVPEEPTISRLEIWLGPVGTSIFRKVAALFSPITVAMYIALVCALVPQLKALFVKSDEGPIYSAPDGNPPLNFLIETAELVGDMTVPLALILLGASFARMKVPKPFSRLPLPAIFAVTFAKLVVLPVIGIVFSQGLVTHGLVQKESLVERFVGMLLSGTPSAVNQLVVTQLFTKDPGDLDTLCAFLLAQYIVMFVSTAVITGISLALL